MAGRSSSKPISKVNIESMNQEINYLGLVDIEGVDKTFGILTGDRRRHTYILGKSGMGKSTLLENMILQDIYAGHGACYIDPLGDSAQSILDRIPSYRTQDVIYFNPSDRENCIGINLLETKDNESASLITAEIMSIMERIWSGAWSPRMEYIMSNALLALIDVGDQTLMGTLKMFGDQKFMEKVAQVCNNIIVKNFWQYEYKQFPPAYKVEAVAAIQNKIGQLFANKLIANIIGQVKSTVDFHDIINNRKILICNLSKGQIGESNCNLLGSLIVTKLQLAAMSRATIAEQERRDFYLYIDEFQNFINDSFVTILAEARKFRLNLTLAHQYLGQLDGEESDKIKQAIFGNVGTLITFQLGQMDAETMGKEMQIENINYFQDLDVGQILIKPSIDSKQVSTFFANTLTPMYMEFSGNLESCISISRNNWTRAIDEVEQEIVEYYRKEPVDNAKTRRAKKRAEERYKRINGEGEEDSQAEDAEEVFEQFQQNNDTLIDHTEQKS